MAFPKPELSAFLLFAIVALSFTTPSAAAECGAGAGEISVYWGQKSEATEGTLESLCSSGNYNIVIIQSLLVYDDGREPTINLANHSAKLQPEIEYCQQNNIKVLLSIGQDVEAGKAKSHRHYSSSSDTTAAAEKLASYLLEKYLSGNAGPLGSVALDGINIADVADGDNLKWDEVVKAINASTTERKIYLGAAPQCVYPDYYLGKVISTGLIDYIWVEFFYQNPCIYANGDASNLLKEWNKWSAGVPGSKIFLGLVAAGDAGIAGYIPPEDLISTVLPTVRQSSNYGGVAIYDRAFDIANNYTAHIKSSVPKGCICVCNGDDVWNRFYGLGSASLSRSV
ncbi:acidic endochitinase-like [Vigna radiata var. radiata]|uniref:Acidic endochitinase-like n=1 Tax=Vigna radiata var. radiata TaxID=3916 RepID=A0A1S3U349_VIGRR|nr:acidic endochitinase-like [Vigna radiata var. radiata]